MFTRRSFNRFIALTLVIVISILNCSKTTNAQLPIKYTDEFLETYLEGDLDNWSNFTFQKCATKKVHFNEEDAKTRFYGCLRPQFAIYSPEDLNSLNETLTRFGDIFLNEMITNENSSFSNEFLQHFKFNVLGHFCSHLPLIINCFYEEFYSGISDCWPTANKILIEYFNEILPSLCDNGGIKLEGLLTPEGQACVENYKRHIDICIYAVNLNRKSKNDFCEFVPCLQQIGSNFPCEDKNSEIILRYLFEDAQLSKGCVLNTYLHEYIEEECKENEIIPEEKHFDDFAECLSPFLSGYHLLSSISNSTLQNTRYGNYLYESLYQNFENDSSLICELLVSKSCNTTKQFIADCYQPSEPFRGFLKYYEYFVDIQCANGNGTHIKEMLVEDKLECLAIFVNGLVSCTESLEDKRNSKEIDTPPMDSGICGSLKYLHTCSNNILLNSCFNNNSLALLKTLTIKLDERINAVECSGLLPQEVNKNPFSNISLEQRNAQEPGQLYGQQAVLMYVLLGILGIVFIFVVISISCKRLIPFTNVRSTNASV